MANLSIYGLTLLYDGTGTIFDELVLPTQFTDPTVLTDRLMLDTMELEVLYADPDVFKGALGIYSKSRLQTWQKMTDAMYKEYDPFINFTRDETKAKTSSLARLWICSSAQSTTSRMVFLAIYTHCSTVSPTKQPINCIYTNSRVGTK